MSLRIIVFFLIGLIIFILDVAFNSAQDSKDIYISDQELTSLLSAWQSQVGRPPNDEEIVNIINNFVQEEILYREALLLNLDEEDRIIKRRLAQKITFLKQETVPEDPSQEELKRQQILLESYDLPTEIPLINKEDVMTILMGDKKVRDGKMRFILPREIGDVDIYDDVEDSLFLKFFT